MAEKRRGLGRGLGALIPSGPSSDARPVDVFFPGAPTPAKPTPSDGDGATTATAGVIYGGLSRGWGEQDLSIVSEVYAEPMESTAPQAPASPPAAPAPPEMQEAEPAEPGAEETVEDLEKQPADMTVKVTQGPVDIPDEAPDKMPAPEAAERKEKDFEAEP